MSAADLQMEQVLLLACLTEDRDKDEQRAMLAVALRLDRVFGACTAHNVEFGKARPPTLVAEVEGTVEIGCDGGGDRVSLTAAQAKQYQRLVEKWKPCDKCGEPIGWHYADGCRDKSKR